MLVNVRVIVERMDIAGRRHEELFSVPADLIDKLGRSGVYTGPGSEVSTIALQLMEAFVKGYKDICHASVGMGSGSSSDQGNAAERGSSESGGGTASSLSDNAQRAQRLRSVDRGLEGRRQEYEGTWPELEGGQ